jgi:hypothetical protein
LLEELWGVVLPDELGEPEVSELEPALPVVELLLFRSELPEVPVLLPPGVNAPPVAELLPDNPKYEKTLWRQLG